MKALIWLSFSLSCWVVATAPKLLSQTPGEAAAAPPEGHQRGMRPDDGGPAPLIGQITAIHNGTLQIAKPDGSTASVKLTDKTEFRRDRQPAKAADFKVGDFVLIRGQENPDHSVTAAVVGGRSGGGPNGGGKNGGGFMNAGPVGTLGKDFVVGEVKSIDAPSITVLRPDNVTQSFELNEETSLRKGRDSITMADIQVGDHLVARAASPGETFVPKTVFVIEPEQWKRMQEAGWVPGQGKPPQPQPQKPAGPNN